MKLTPKSYLVLCLLIFASYFLLFPDLKSNEYFTSEDGIIENLGALAFGISACLFGWIFVKSGDKYKTEEVFRVKNNYWYLGLCLLFLFACGEEISWGQRIFGWETPESMKEANVQQETNLHNLEFLVNHHERDEANTLLDRLLVLTAGRLFMYFWVTYMVFVPIINGLSIRARIFFQKIRLPIPPIWSGILMILTYTLFLIFVSFTSSYPIDTYGSLSEIKETNYAIIVAAWAASWAADI